MESWDFDEVSFTSVADSLDFCTSDEDELLDNASDVLASTITSVHSRRENCISERASMSSANSRFAHGIQETVPELDFRHCASPLQKIELIFAHLTTALQAGDRPLTIAIKSRSSKAAKSSATDLSPSPSTKSERARTITFPGKTANEGWRFSMVVRILELMHEALSEDVTLSKRDIYYRDPALFGLQAYVDRYVDDIAFTLAVPRSALNVTAVAKGLVAGAVTFTRQDGTVSNASSDREGMLVPIMKDILFADTSRVKFVLVIEKEATFRSIAASDLWDEITEHGIILTGKGYPDISTRALLHFLSTPSARNGFASPEVFGLADFDPDGMAILSTYKHGSLALAHEGAELLCPSLQWLGLRSRHVIGIVGGSQNAAQGLLSLTPRDRRMAVRMLERSLENDVYMMDWWVELQRMLVLGFKAEMQLLDAVPNNLMAMLREFV